MIIEISKPEFMSIAQNNELDLPKRWDGNDFYETLKSLYEKYITILSDYISSDDSDKVSNVCDKVLRCINHYHDGFPSKAYNLMSVLMKDLVKHPLITYRKTGFLDNYGINDPLMLFRIRNVQNNTNYMRKDIFHVPYKMRSKISTFRYSISGYPCLYLATSLDLCLEESKTKNFNDITIASCYKIQRDIFRNGGVTIDVIELALKPKDFLNFGAENGIDNTIGRGRKFSEINLEDSEVMSSYLYWYPLIAACSFIRANKKDPFASEYIIPQLLMQWIRKERGKNRLIGIRYFSCASERASEMGFNYVFPVSGLKDEKYKNYCKILSNIFEIAIPVFINEFDTVEECQNHLTHKADFERI